MGKQTRFHPVSLNIIRGAAEFAGFKLGKLRQNAPADDSNPAKYTVQLLDFPYDCQKQELLTIKDKLNGAFSLDVVVDDVWVTRSGKIYAGLSTSTQGGPKAELPPEEDRDWLAEGFQQ